jgi:hypothetical protein
MPIAGISFICYEACKRILIEGEKDEREREIDDVDDEVNGTA